VPDTLTIGVVEDDPSFLRALRRLLSAAGFTVAAFASAEEFLASESAGATACLVLDVHLGGMSGFDLQQRLAAAGAPIPTIFITAHDDPVTRERDRSGVAYLRKPFREGALIGAIQQVLDHRGA
jgi:FixJ family two-component response regulator